MKVTVITVVVGALDTVPKSLERKKKELEIRERNNTIQTTVFEDRIEY